VRAKESKACRNLLVAECPRDMRAGKRPGVCGHQEYSLLLKGFVSWL